MKTLTRKPKGETWIAHYGGSFNPIHNGHLAIARKLVEQLGFDRIIFVPNGDSYNKSGLAPAADRLALIEHAIAGNASFASCDFEVKSDTAVRTVETLEELRRDLADEYDSFRLFSIRGDDAVMKIRTWRSLEQFFDLSELIVVPRHDLDLDAEFADGGKLAIGRDRTWVIDDLNGIPSTSSSGIRRGIICNSSAVLDVPTEVQSDMSERGMYGMSTPGEEWITLYRPGYSGASKQRRDALRREFFGDGTWRTAFRWGTQVMTYNAALQLYEDAYMDHFLKSPDVLAWLLDTAYDVFDNSDSNVFSKFDYSIQEARTTHLQDVAVRRCVMRLGEKFRGDHLVEIRTRESEGFRLNPGQVPFHMQELIVQPEPMSWWLPGSVESFWQANKVFQVKERVFCGETSLSVHLLVQNVDGYILVQEQEAERKSAQLPAIHFNAGAGFHAQLRDQVQAFGFTPVDVIPTLAEPLAVDRDLHTMVKLSGSHSELPTGFRWVQMNSFRSHCRNKSVNQLLRKSLQ